MSAYYNEFDKEKAAWLRELIKAGLIAPGEVDERSIENVDAAELVGFTQCHFFAGIGVWSYSLRLAGWPDDRAVWTGSCPCPSFSCAGKGAGFDDPRHLWPHWARLIRECKPAAIFGEQADDAIGFGWLDLVQTDLEAEAYAIGKAVLGAASVGASDIRQRLYFVGHAIRPGLEGFGGNGDNGDESGWDGADEAGSTAATGVLIGMADAECDGGRADVAGRESQGRIANGWDDAIGELADTHGGNAGTKGLQRFREYGQQQSNRSSMRRGASGLWHNSNGELDWSSPLNGFWRDADWLFCRDGKWRPVEPGTLVQREKAEAA